MRDTGESVKTGKTAAKHVSIDEVWTSAGHLQVVRGDLAPPVAPEDHVDPLKDKVLVS